MLRKIKNFLDGIVKFIKQYPGILYSLALVVILPLLLYYNVFFSLRLLQKNIDYTLQTKALAIENILSVFFADFLDDSQTLQKMIERITLENPDIKDLFVAKEAKGGGFKIIASQNPSEIGEINSDPVLSLSYSQNQTTANLRTENRERFWKVVTPIYNKYSKEKEGIIGLSLSLRDLDLLLSQIIFRSYLILFFTIILTLFLVLQHTRLFGYVSLSKKLKELDKMKDDFIRMTTHELRNPIVAIRGYLDILEGNLKDIMNKEQKEQMKRVKTSAKNLNDLIEDILEVSRIQQGRLDFTPELISPSEKIKETVEELKLKAEGKGLELKMELAPGNYFIKVNPERFRQIMFNLIDNAIKYTPKGRVIVKTRVEEGRERYIIEVKDTGFGISAENQKRLFEQFYRVKTRETSSIQGTGLGLWITKQICEKMNGKIFLESMEGVGTKFTVIFPLREQKTKESKT